MLFRIPPFFSPESLLHCDENFSFKNPMLARRKVAAKCPFLQASKKAPCLKPSLKLDWVQENSRRLWRSRRRKKNPAAFPKAGPIFQRPLSLPENAQTLAGIACRAAGKSGNSFSSSVEMCRNTFPATNFGQPQPSRVF